MAEPPFDPAVLLAASAEADVSFRPHRPHGRHPAGDVGVTIDIDITPADDPDNLHRLANALRAIDARTRTDDAPDGLILDRSTEFLRHRDRALGARGRC